METLRTIILQRLQEVGLFWGGVTVKPSAATAALTAEAWPHASEEHLVVTV